MISTAHQRVAFEELQALGPYVWYDLAAHLTCTESEVFADFLAAFGLADEASFKDAHAEADENGYAHYTDNEEES